MSEPLTVAMVQHRDEMVPDRGGIYSGKVWHYRSTKWMGKYHLTACGRIFDPGWRPGYRNIRPKTCAKCVKVSMEHSPTTSPPPTTLSP